MTIHDSGEGQEVVVGSLRESSFLYVKLGVEGGRGGEGGGGGGIRDVDEFVDEFVRPVYVSVSTSWVERGVCARVHTEMHV